MKRILTFGVFDILHYGHVRLFERAGQLCENVYLIVAIQRDKDVVKYKPNTKLKFDENIRAYMAGSIRWVGETIFYSDVDVDIKNIDFDVLCLGEDQTHQGFQNAIEWCRKNKKEIVMLPRTKGICSSQLR